MSFPNTFSIRLALQHKIEDWSAEKLIKHFGLSNSVVYAPRNIEFTDYDFVIDHYGPVEVKNDQMCCKTGNIAIEFKKWSQGFTNERKSGIDLTQALYYCIVIDRMVMHKKFFEVVFIETEKLRKIILDNRSRVVTSNYSCPNPTQCYLVRYDLLKEYSLGIFEQNVC
jgi:hypothetical protein